MRRVGIQLAFVATSLALFGVGAAHAESDVSVVTNVTQENTTQEAVVETSQSTTINIEQSSSSQTVSETENTAPSEPSQASAPGVSSTPLVSAPEIVQPPVIIVGDEGLASSPPEVAASRESVSLSPGSAVTTTRSDLVALVQYAIAQREDALANTSNPAPFPRHPASPPMQGGLLDGIRAALNGSIVPALGQLELNLSTYRAVSSPVLAALALVIFLIISWVNSYAGRMRRAGYVGAARSDVGGASLHFVTPQVMGCIPAYATG